MYAQSALRLFWLSVLGLLIGCTPERSTLPLQPSATATTLPPSHVIALVAGHRGESKGATCSDGVTEVDITTDITLRVQDKLHSAGYPVEVLDEFDARLDNYQPAVLVALHADACVRGVSGFKIASRALRDTTRARQLRDCLQNRYRQATQLQPQILGVTPAMTHYYAFDQLASETPAAIIELGFISTDRALLLDQPDRVAQGVYEGIICFLEGEKR